MTTRNTQDKYKHYIDEVNLQPLLSRNVGVTFPASKDNGCDVSPNTNPLPGTFTRDANQNRMDRRTNLGLIGGTSSRKQSVVFTKPPDGGWGWVVVFSSFAISLLVDGVVYTFGIFFDEFRNEFHTTKAETSLVGVVLSSTYAAVGPVVGALVKMYGCRNVSMSGAVLASFAFFVSTFSNSITVLILTYGVMGGLGFGLMYLPAIVMVGYYFERRRALATGIACCGSGVGTFVFAPLCEYLILQYGWKGALWVISALILNGAVFALFYRPLPAPTSTSNFEEPRVSSSKISVLTVSELADDIIEMDQPQKLPIAGKGRDYGETSALAVDNAKNEIEYMLEQGYRPNLHGTRSVELEKVSQPHVPTRLSRSIDIDFQLHRKKRGSTGVDHASGSTSTKGSSGSFFNPMLRKDIFYSGNLQGLKEYRGQDQPGNEQVKSQAAQNKSTNHSTLDNSLNGPRTSESKRKSIIKEISTLFDFGLLKSPTFLIFGTSAFLCMVGLPVPFIYLPTHVTDLGLDSWQASSLVSIIGISNTGLRIAVGYIADAPWVDCLILNTVALLIGGSATTFVTYLPNYALLASYACVFGLFLAVFMSLRTIIIVELMGLERLTTAFGLASLCQGMGGFIGAPIAGLLSDTYGDYYASFYLAGASITLSGIICIPLRHIARWEGERYWRREVRVTECESNENSFCMDKKTTVSTDGRDSPLGHVEFVDLTIGSSVDEP